MDLSKKLPDMSEDDQLRLLASDGMLVKRPLLVGKDFVLAGFKQAEWEEKLMYNNYGIWGDSCALLHGFAER